MKSTFSIIFYLKRQVVKKDGTVPVMGRITVDGTQAQFSCKTTANPDLWDTKGGRMIGKSMQALEVNRKLDKMRVSISKHYQEIMDRDNFVTADKVKNAFLGLNHQVVHGATGFDFRCGRSGCAVRRARSSPPRPAPRPPRGRNSRNSG